jgi:hypothetical protein
VNWSVLTDPDANLRDDARAELARHDRGACKALSQEVGTIVNKTLEKMIRAWFARGAQDRADVDVRAASDARTEEARRKGGG